MSPNRLLFLLGVLFAALMLGAGVAILRSLTQPVFLSKRSLAAATGLPVIGVVSRSRSSAALLGERSARIAFMTASVALVVAIVGVGVVSYPISLMLRQAIGLEGT